MGQGYLTSLSPRCIMDFVGRVNDDKLQIEKEVNQIRENLIAIKNKQKYLTWQFEGTKILKLKSVMYINALEQMSCESKLRVKNDFFKPVSNNIIKSLVNHSRYKKEIAKAKEMVRAQGVVTVDKALEYYRDLEIFADAESKQFTKLMNENKNDYINSVRRGKELALDYARILNFSEMKNGLSDFYYGKAMKIFISTYSGLEWLNSFLKEGCPRPQITDVIAEIKSLQGNPFSLSTGDLEEFIISCTSQYETFTEFCKHKSKDSSRKTYEASSFLTDMSVIDLVEYNSSISSQKTHAFHEFVRTSEGLVAVNSFDGEAPKDRVNVIVTCHTMSHQAVTTPDGKKYNILPPGFSFTIVDLIARNECVELVIKESLPDTY